MLESIITFAAGLALPASGSFVAVTSTRPIPYGRGAITGDQDRVLRHDDLAARSHRFHAQPAPALPEAIGRTVTVGLRAYDAGSEANTELCPHVPFEVHDRRITAGAEGGLGAHPGIWGDADIAPGRGWRAPSWAT